MTATRRVAFQTLGCRLNQSESDAIAVKFQEAGYDIVSWDEVADVYVVNTCTVTSKSDRKSRNTINRVRRQNADAIVVVTGCYVDGAKDKVERESGADYVVDNDRKAHIFELVEAHYRGEMVSPDAYETDRFSFDVADNPAHTRAAVKIQDGCDNFCTFCIIPFVRGGAVSRPADEVKSQFIQLLESGFKEIILTGINISRYQDGDTDFTALVESLLEIDGDFRIRIPSMEPECIDERFYDLFNHPKMCPQVHLCLQSGSEKILLQMRREYTAEQFTDIVNRLRQVNPLFNITTDIIIGFPGETEEDFEDTLKKSRELAFGHIHSFPYSRREGTRADRMKDQLDSKVKSARGKILHDLMVELKYAYRRQLIGLEQRVLVEQRTDDGLHVMGYGEYYVPIKIANPLLQSNTWQQVKIIGIEESGDNPALIGELI